MITINISNKDRIKYIKISGHSDYAITGKDIVCAGVTSIVQGMFNAICKMCNKNSVDIKLKPSAEIQAKVLAKDINDQKLQILLKALYYQLLTVQLQFPDFIIINKED